MWVRDPSKTVARWKADNSSKTAPGTSFFRHYLLGQARVEQFLIDLVKEEGK
jgi:hypothetical protein